MCKIRSYSFSVHGVQCKDDRRHRPRSLVVVVLVVVVTNLVQESGGDGVQGEAGQVEAEGAAGDQPVVQPGEQDLGFANQCNWQGCAQSGCIFENKSNAGFKVNISAFVIARIRPLFFVFSLLFFPKCIFQMSDSSNNGPVCSLTKDLLSPQKNLQPLFAASLDFLRQILD
jgi:hypothetical protein